MQIGIDWQKEVLSKIKSASGPWVTKPENVKEELVEIPDNWFVKLSIKALDKRLAEADEDYYLILSPQGFDANKEAFMAMSPDLDFNAIEEHLANFFNKIIVHTIDHEANLQARYSSISKALDGLTETNQINAVEALIDGCESYVKLFSEADVRPEDEAHEVFGKCHRALKLAESQRLPVTPGVLS